MARRVLDTSVLAYHWNSRGGNSPSGKTEADAIGWATELAELRDTRAILCPVYIEFICGMTTQAQMQLAEAFLSKFEVIDQWYVLPQDVQEAKRIAKRIPFNSKPRQLGDCLVRAMANRLRQEVVTFDKAFPK